MSVTLSASLSTIGILAFSSNVELTSITLPATIPPGFDDGNNWQDNDGTMYALGDEITNFGNVSYTFNGTPTDYPITYTLNEGTIAPGANPATYNVRASTITLANPTRDDYTFAGWYIEATFEHRITQIVLGSTGNLSLHAKWEAVPYGITYELNSGTNSPDNPDTYTIEDAITLADPTRDGYTFLGWYTTATFTTEVTEITLGSTGVRAFYARWLYTLASADVTVTAGVITAYTGSATAFAIPHALDGETITGVGMNAFREKTLTEVNLSLATGLTAIEDSAFWSNALVSIDLSPATRLTTIGDGAFADNSLTSVDLPAGLTAIGANAFGGNTGLTITLPAEIPTGFASGDWQDGDGMTYALDTDLPDLSLSYTFVGMIATYDIMYELDGGTNATANPSTYTIETATITLADPMMRTGYTFAGWYSEAAFTTEVIELPMGSAGDTTFYAKWEAISYSITYELNSGTNATANPSTYTIETATITLADPTREGYTFAGWYTEATFTTKVTELATGSTGNKTFHAKWEEIVSGIGETLSLTVYPNPTQAYFTISSEEVITAVRLYDLSGQLIRTYTSPTSGERYAVSGLSSGTYVLETTDFQDRIHRGRLVVKK